MTRKWMPPSLICPRCRLPRRYRNGNAHLCHPELIGRYEPWDGRHTGMRYSTTMAALMQAQAAVQGARR